jgi:hypothetical protein
MTARSASLSIRRRWGLMQGYQNADGTVAPLSGKAYRTGDIAIRDEQPHAVPRRRPPHRARLHGLPLRLSSARHRRNSAALAFGKPSNSGVDFT